LGRYVSGIKEGHIIPGAKMRLLTPATTIGVLDAANGLGQVAGDMAIHWAIQTAKQHGLAVVTVKNSNHYGIAGYYAEQAVAQNLVAISLTNSAPLVVPTNGADVLLGTNPIAFAAPAGKHPAFLLDMATSVVPRGKLEVYDRNRREMPGGWAVDEHGYDCKNAGQVLKNLIERTGGGILPLGGRGELFSGYKGYGLALMVDILCGVLSGSAYGADVDDVHRASEGGEKRFPNVGHFFLVMDPSRFMPLEEFKDRMDDLIASLKNSRKALDQHTIFVHGEKEFAKAAVHREVGVPLSEVVTAALRKLAQGVSVEMPPFVASGVCRRDNAKIASED
jgi:LDH2 family malate/lactate/ureidoglycolate dehydrogenase